MVEPTNAQSAASSSNTARPAPQPDVKEKENTETSAGQKQRSEPEVLGRSVSGPGTETREPKLVADAAERAQEARREIHVEDVAPVISSPESSGFADA
ncbi:hypothetical protein MferCBS31731_000419 [Microsporum ferrugineum]